MADNNTTIFQRLNNVFRGTGRSGGIPQEIVAAPSQGFTQNSILYSTNDKADYERKLASLRQQKYLAYQWKKAEVNNAMDSLASYNAVKLMYRDVDLMDNGEIGTALDIISEEACPINSKGKMLNIYSSSPRVKAILNDLFINRLHIYTELPMIARHMCKYGNTFELLNINKDNGVMGWMMVPVYEMDRDENGYGSSYTVPVANANEMQQDQVKFIWRGQNGDNPYFNWQIAHFRLLNDSFFLPYGVSMLHKARRPWRMWSMMEDAMLIWRLDKAVERRVFKIYVGGIDDADVPAYVNEIANNFKRTQIIDPSTGQVDLRKNFIDVSGDYFIPVRSENAPNPIETLQAANSQVQMEDIEYMQNKIFCTMRVPKSFLNFQEAQGKGQNLSFIDVRFARMINRVQQFLLMELNKIAMIHLFTIGLVDEIGNFSLTLNNPSSQIEAQELDDLTKRLAAMQTALADPGTGIPMMSMHKALREIMKMSDSEIKDMLNEIYLEKAMSAEIASAANMIKESNMFDPVKNIYGDYDAMNSDNSTQQQQNEDDGMGGGGMMGGGAPMGGDLGGDMDMDMGEPGSEDGSDLGGDMGETDMAGAPAADDGSPLMESPRRQKPIILEHYVPKKSTKTFMEQYFDMLSESSIENGEEVDESFDFETKNATLNEQAKQIFSKIDNLVNEDSMERENIISEVMENIGLLDTDGEPEDTTAEFDDGLTANTESNDEETE